MKMKLSFITGAVALALCLLPANKASAIIITPTGTSFGSLPAATFGGTGIPNDAVQITQIGNLVLGVTATQRFGNPALTNDGAGTFTAQAGGDTINGAPTLAKWNFDYYVSGIRIGQTTALFYDNNPAALNNVTTFYPGGNLNYQDSENLGFGAFNGGTFSPNANGEYNFALVAFDSLGAEIGRSAILVKVEGASSVTDGGSTVIMLGAAFGAIGVISYRRKSSLV